MMEYFNVIAGISSMKRDWFMGDLKKYALPMEIS